MFRQILLSSLGLLLICPLGSEPAAARTTRINCESQNGRTTRCPVNARRAQVRLIRTRSAAPCEGNWDFENGNIVVRNGCRGEFEVRIDNHQGNSGDGWEDNLYKEFRLPNIGRFVVDRRSYYDSGRIREFDAIVNGSRERWWANCRGGELGSGSRRIRSSREIDRVVDFVCEDRG
ncbi:MAG: DUF3011 domain-containing protein [Microcystis aeruginosa Ma_MB_F_20061100_S20]|uniref:DUF3011 domain-containing protein n=1 Tax=Microcystis aeruginosa Ma_MB_F_20061100_S20D TaxID=2486253 RepID=A0A552EXU8_MICAE|nr:MAG: DUF3011 domain-containing protein [Microcystis aeruginosa Ma_MB_F_20061100_S20]TRU39283.1 MAG: DUF3011 domain-containing protein [Microcystis aeruginosa Ma_MB_F_20061100_S20D]